MILFRLPYKDYYCEFVEDETAEGGFVIAPFCTNDNRNPLEYLPKGSQNFERTPNVLFIKGKAQKHRVPFSPSLPSLPSTPSLPSLPSPPSTYASAFAKFHEAVCEGKFKKLVLSRKQEVKIEITECKSLFFKACQLYPSMMIELVSLPETGTWLVCSPEVLLESKDGEFHTMALAGTMPWKEGEIEWSEKNKEEQHLVSQYIDDTIKPFATDIRKEGPKTHRAGNICHLLTEYWFKGLRAQEFISSKLSPTPAVCGLPKEKAYDFIAENEGYDRRYFSGYMGPVNIGGETHLFVTLRCAELFPGHALLYAGGGIMPDSSMEAEFEETKRKMQTILNVINH